MNKFLLLLPFLLLLACGQEETTVTNAECYQLSAGTHLPRFFSTPQDIRLSYVNSQGEGNALMAGPLTNLPHKFSPTVYQLGNDWFVNWADFPSVAYFGQGPQGSSFFHHTLRYSSSGTYNYDITYSLANNDGPLFAPRKLHQDTVSAEHGFLSSAPLPGGGLQVTWLDGRYTKEGGEDAGAKEVDDHGHGSGGAMTLRTKALSDSISVELDHRVCDCCATATVATNDLVMVAYRDRSEHEIRDISFVTKPISADKWSTPKLVHADNWEITGCPVNGPALAANDAGNVAVVWHTAPADLAQINFARYNPDTDQFSSPTLLDDEIPLGRVDIQLADDGTAYVTGLTTKEGTDDAFLTLWTISPAGEIEREDLVTTSAARSSGFPKIALFKDKLYWARTVVGAEKGKQFVEVCWR